MVQEVVDTRTTARKMSKLEQFKEELKRFAHLFLLHVFVIMDPFLSFSCSIVELQLSTYNILLRIGISTHHRKQEEKDARAKLLNLMDRKGGVADMVASYVGGTPFQDNSGGTLISK